VHSNLQVFNKKAGAQNAATREAVGYFLEAYQKSLYPGPLRLPELCLKSGLEHIAQEIFPTDQYPNFEKVRTQGKGFLCGSCTAMLPFLVKDELRGLSAEHAEEVVKRSMDELDGDIYIHSEIQFIVRRKAIQRS
jgi:hypothetical protein